MLEVLAKTEMFGTGVIVLVLLVLGYMGRRGR